MTRTGTGQDWWERRGRFRGVMTIVTLCPEMWPWRCYFSLPGSLDLDTETRSSSLVSRQGDTGNRFDFAVLYNSQGEYQDHLRRNASRRQHSHRQSIELTKEKVIWVVVERIVSNVIWKWSSVSNNTTTSRFCWYYVTVTSPARSSSWSGHACWLPTEECW